jgi:hypothetical protein
MKLRCLPSYVAEEDAAVCVCSPINRWSWALEGSPRRGDCGSPVKWKLFIVCPFRTTVVLASVGDFVMVPLSHRMNDDRNVRRPLKE